MIFNKQLEKEIVGGEVSLFLYIIITHTLTLSL